MAVRDELPAPFGLGEVVGSIGLDQGIGQDLLERSARDIAGRERAIKRVRGLAANRLNTCRMKPIAVERSPGGRLFIARADPFLAKGLLPTSKQADIVPHALAIMCEIGRASCRERGEKEGVG